jgi:hypothetical protein
MLLLNRNIQLRSVLSKVGNLLLELDVLGRPSEALLRLARYMIGICGARSHHRSILRRITPRSSRVPMVAYSEYACRDR